MQYFKSKIVLPMDKKTETSSLMHGLSGDSAPLFNRRVIVIIFVTILLGLGSGYLLARVNKNTQKTGVINQLVNSTTIKKGEVFGSDDFTVYKDDVEGVLKEGGVDDEGQYHLVRPGGESQNVYLTSSIIDLSKFINRKIKVWGQTQKAQKAGWLMDVGRVEVL